MSIYLYNSLARKKQKFVPLDAKRVTMYACGPTVYSYAHTGNARPAVIVCLLHKVLQSSYPNVVYARNITDIDDTITQAAAQQNVTIAVITERFARIYRSDMAALGVGAPPVEPHATEHNDAMIAMI